MRYRMEIYEYKENFICFYFFVLGVMYAKDERKMEYDAYL